MRRILGISRHASRVDSAPDAIRWSWVPPSCRAAVQPVFANSPSLVLLHRLPDAPSWVLADMACDACTYCTDMRAMGAVAPRDQAARAVSRLHLPAPQPDRTLLVAVEGAACHHNPLRRDRDILCSRRRHRCITGLNQKPASINTEMRTDPNKAFAVWLQSILSGRESARRHCGSAL